MQEQMRDESAMYLVSRVSRVSSFQIFWYNGYTASSITCLFA